MDIDLKIAMAGALIVGLVGLRNLMEHIGTYTYEQAVIWQILTTIATIGMWAVMWAVVIGLLIWIW
jgi:hypothetical protein